MSSQDGPGDVQLTKKQKHAIKRDAFMQKLELSKTHSKSHERRLKRKAKGQIANGMADIQSALAALEEPVEATVAEDAAQKEGETAPPSKATSKSVKIGEGKPEPLSKAQRKKALQLERLRQPLILTNPTFSTNPFSTVRLHAQNTLVKHQTPSS
ncbi:ribosome biogenesis protein SLX9-domain-containing protein [Coprinopsis sp. MPI-PUGE-AT-0042]|nr:ribosome biogenesis protein SLX9-domain-containing protein [Coprinopsis sp. MPI-PUGE-AT-0042]